MNRRIQNIGGLPKSQHGQLCATVCDRDCECHNALSDAHYLQHNEASSGFLAAQWKILLRRDEDGFECPAIVPKHCQNFAVHRTSRSSCAYCPNEGNPQQWRASLCSTK